MDNETLLEKWISAKFDGKLVISAERRKGYVNVKLSVMNGKEYTTKLGKAMSVQLGPKDIDEMIAALQDIREKHLPAETKTE